MNIPLEVVVVSLESHPLLAELSLLLALSMGAPKTFMGWFSREIQSLEEWTRAVRTRRGEPSFKISEQELAHNFCFGLRFLLGHQWAFLLTILKAKYNSKFSMPWCTDITCSLLVAGSSSSRASPRGRRWRRESSSSVRSTRAASSLWSSSWRLLDWLAGFFDLVSLFLWEWCRWWW